MPSTIHNQISVCADWDDFIDNYHEKKACILDLSGFGGLPFSEMQAVDAIRCAFDSRNKIHLHSEFERRIHLDGKRLVSPVLSPENLPASGEKYISFIERLFSGLDARTLALVLHNCHSYAPTAYRSAKRFLAPLVERLGAPSVMVGLDMFVGKYLTTPEMLHKDTGMVFMFPLIGEKSMAVWPWEYFAKDEPDSMYVNRNLKCANLTEHLGNATIMTARPGQALYWPSTWWHIAHSDNLKPTLTMNVTWYMASTVRSLIAPVVQKAMDDKRLLQRIDQLPPQPLGDIRLDDVTLPDEVRDFLTDLERKLRLFCVQKNSSAGFANVPRSPVEVDGKQLSLVNRDAAITRIADADGVINAVFDGQIIRFSGSDAINRLIDSINRGETIDLSKEENSGYVPLMAELAKVGAVTICEEFHAKQ
jgi:hypothetical protein